MNLGLLEHAPVPCYAFRRAGDEFILEHINTAARRHNPVLASLIGKPMAGLYSDQPQVLADAMRCAIEQVVVDQELAVRRYDRTEATQYVRQLRVIFMSGYSSDMQEMRVDGALFLQKPFSRQELATRLAELHGAPS